MNLLKIKQNDKLTSSIDMNEEITFIHNHDKYTLHNNNFNNYQKKAIKWMFIISFIQMLVVIFSYKVFNFNYMPITGPRSFSMTVIALLISGIIIISIFWYVKYKKANLKFSELLNIFNFLEILLSLIIFVLLGTIFFFYLFQKLFLGLPLKMFLSAVISFFIFSYINYSILYFLFSFTLNKLIRLLSYFLVGGVFITMLTNSDKNWWKVHLSFLGTRGANNPWTFNLTLILSAIILIFISDVIYALIKNRSKRDMRITILRYLLLLTFISLACVGIFPVDGPRIQPQLHTIAAICLVILTSLMMLYSMIFLKELDLEFKFATFILCFILLVLTYLFFVKKYMTLTAFELIAFVPSFTWMISLLNQLSNIAIPTDNVFYVEIEKTKD